MTIISSIDDQAPKVAEELRKQAQAYKAQFDLLVSRAHEGLDKAVPETNKQLDDIENAVVTELQSVETDLTGQIDMSVMRIQEKVDEDTASMLCFYRWHS